MHFIGFLSILFILHPSHTYTLIIIGFHIFVLIKIYFLCKLNNYLFFNVFFLHKLLNDNGKFSLHRSEGIFWNQINLNTCILTHYIFKICFLLYLFICFMQYIMKYTIFVHWIHIWPHKQINSCTKYTTFYLLSCIYHWQVHVLKWLLLKLHFYCQQFGFL